MIYCEDCKWYKKPWFNFLPPRLQGHCLNPKSSDKQEGVNKYVYRKTKELPFAGIERAYGNCGNAGKLYEPK